MARLQKQRHRHRARAPAALAAFLIVGILFVGILVAMLPRCEAFSFPRNSFQRHVSITAPARTKRTSRFSTPTVLEQTDYSLETYAYNEWTLSYRYKPASRGYESASPLLFIHPVGIGLDSWFWNKMFQATCREESPALYAPDLIGCGIQNGGDTWDPMTRPLSFPLGWVQGCEALMQQARAPLIPPSVLNALPIPKQTTDSFLNSRGRWIVVCQGGLAPVGVLLAARNPSSVSKLILTSPPTWSDMVFPIPEAELSRNYNFLSSPLVEPIAFGILESRWSIRYFSNLFLFEKECDELWLDCACSAVEDASRAPVAAFNAGLCNHRSFEQELTTLTQPTLILSGNDDADRAGKRQDYQSNMKNCTLKSLPGKNVLPWESPGQVWDAIRQFCD